MIEQTATSTALQAIGINNGLARSEPKPPVMLNVELMREIYQIATIFSASNLVPECYRGGDKSVGRANCFVALSMGFELGIAPMQALTHITVVNGRPGIDGQLAVALANKRAPIKGGIRYEEGGKGDDQFCTAYSIDAESGERREYTLTIADAKTAGWFNKSHSHWTKDPKLMLRYRSAKYLVNTNWPDALMGMHTVDELEDAVAAQKGAQAEKLAAKLESVEVEQAEGETEGDE